MERTLGAPRDQRTTSTEVSLEHIDQVIAATEDALDAEERRGDLDTGRDARTTLLPRTIRDAPISYDYGESAAWELRQAALLREIQDLSCEHTHVADGFDGHDDQARITRLEALRDGLSAARRDALRAGVHGVDIDRAYVLGRDGIYWSTEPSDPRLGRIAQLTQERDWGLSLAARHIIASSGVQQDPDAHRELAPAPETGSARTHPLSSETDPYAAAGARIVAAIDVALAEVDASSWTTSADPPPVGTPVPAERDTSPDP